MESKIEKIEVEENLRKIVSARGQDTLLLVDKINEIIDHLNSQDQEGENNFVYTVGTPILESTTTCSQDTPEEITAEWLCEDNRRRMEKLINREMEERGFIKKRKDTPEEKKTLVQLRRVFDKKRVKEWDRTTMETYKQATQDTPEEWEEKQRNLVEKAQRKYYDFRRQEKFLIDDVDIYKNTREYVEKELVEDIINFTKQLLLERERWAIDTFLKDTASYNSFHNGRPRTMRNGLSGEGFEVRVSKLNKKK